jgi:ubiquinol-cytochrome c reductase cytochrome c subunit
MRRMLWMIGFLLLPAASLYAQGNAENGKKLFVKNGCYQCHGYEAQGTNAGARLAPKPMTLAALIAYVRKPAPGGMPIYSPKVMSDAELTDIWAFLKLIPDTPAVSTIPILNGK